MKRREFLQYAAAMSLLNLRPETVLADTHLAEKKTLLLIELKGGNDGLNTVIPYSDPLYYRYRPEIAISRDQSLPITEKLALHPALQPLMPLWQEQDMAIALGVGYEQPNRSHFRSIEIWETASNSNETLTKGWLDQSLPIRRNRDLDAVILGKGSGPVQGGRLKTVSLNPFQKKFTSRESKKMNAHSKALQHVLDTQALIESSSKLFESTLRPLPSEWVFPANDFGRQMEMAARILLSGIDIPVIKVSLGSFDTHAQQAGRHQRLLKMLADSVIRFQQIMQAHQRWNNVMLMTYSEFGRRVKENGSKGTDHGTAAPHFIWGGAVKGGLYGQQPSLNDLDNGDLEFSMDYRSLYATVGYHWLGFEHSSPLAAFPRLRFI